MKKLTCKIFGHDWRYNFPSIPNKAICKRCNEKILLDMHSLQWDETLFFYPELGTDKELKERWFKLK